MGEAAQSEQQLFRISGLPADAKGGQFKINDGFCFGVHSPPDPLWSNYTFFSIPVLQADVRLYKDLAEVCKGADCVFHAASFGMTGTEQVSAMS